MLNRQQILGLTNNGRDVFAHFLGRELTPGKNFQNPLLDRQQATPSFNIYPDQNGEWRFKDFAEPDDQGSCIDFVMRWHGDGASEAMQRICAELNLDDETKTSSRLARPEPSAVRAALDVDERIEQGLVCIKSSFSSEDEAFWAQYGITTEVLKNNGVAAIESYQGNKRDGSPYTVYGTAERPLFGYAAAPGQWKIYRPEPKAFTWVGGQPKEYVFGLHLLPADGKLVLLAAGEKDALALQAHGYVAISLSSETATPPVSLVERLQHFDRVLVCYDADKTGREQALKLNQKYGWGVVELPAELIPYGKDAADLFRAVKQGFLSGDLLEQAVAQPHIGFTRRKLNEEKITGMTHGFMRLRTARQRMLDAESQPPLQPLFGSLWGTPGVALLVGDANVGKSVLAVRIAHAVSAGQSELLGQPCGFTGKVLFYDFELTDRQLQKRFPSLPFSDNLIMADPNPLAEEGEMTFEYIGQQVDETGARVVILDNITALALRSTADADTSLAIMKGLKRLQTEKGVSTLVLAHVPKLPRGVPLDNTHVAGSKLLVNFADSVFFIARSAQGDDLRYLKQVKNRDGELCPGVLVCRTTDDDGSWGFHLEGQDDEEPHLASVAPPVATTGPASALVELAKSLKAQGKTVDQVHEEVTEQAVSRGIKAPGRATVGRWVKG